MSQKVFFETFLNRDDAYYWMETIIGTEVKDDFVLTEAKLHFVNSAWAVSVLVGKSQMEMMLD